MSLSYKQKQRKARNQREYGIGTRRTYPQQPNIWEGYRIKFVKKAKMWCKSHWILPEGYKKKPTLIQEWSINKPE